MIKFLNRVMIIMLFIPILSCVFTKTAYIHPKQEPKELLISFYTWYVNKIEEGQAPIALYRKELCHYVSNERLKYLIKAYENGSLDIDYFTKSQDVPGDWREHISVSDIEAIGKMTVAQVILGKFDKLNLKVSMIVENGCWKIDKVEESSTCTDKLDGVR